jgi:hypothetical protein
MATAARRYAAPRPRNDAYTGLLAISLLAMVVSCVLLYLDYSQYGDQKPPVMPKIPSSPGGVPLAPADGAGGVPAGGVPAGGAAEGGAPAGGVPMNPMGGAPMNPMGGAPMNPMGGGAGGGVVPVKPGG